MVEFVSASSLNWTPVGLEYLNNSKGLSSETISETYNFLKIKGLSDILDIKINNGTLFYLTNKTNIGSILSNTSNIDYFNSNGYPLSSESISAGGGCETSKAVKYYFCNSNNPQYNTTLDIQNYDIVYSNYLMTCPVLGDFKFNIFTLKSIMTPFYDYGINLNQSYRSYHKIFSGNNQKFGLNDLYLSFSSEFREFVFTKNDTTYFHYPLSGSPVALNESKLIECGAKPGDTPMNSDIIGMDQFNYNDYNSFGKDRPSNNGIFLCAWLSGNNDCDCNSKWMERWYDPDRVTMGDAYISKVNQNTCDFIWDVDSSMELIPGNRYYYDRLGVDRNQVHYDLLYKNCVLDIKNWNNKIINDVSSKEVGNIFPKYNGSEDVLELNGNNYAQILSEDFILQKHKIFTTIDVYKDTWCCGKNTQLIGNYRDGGWGIFFNTGIPNNILTIGDDFGNLYSFNIDGTRLFEKNTNENRKLPNIYFDWIGVDLNGSRWILDKRNNKILKIDVDDLLLNIINIPKSFNISKLQINEDNEIMFFELTTQKIYVHSPEGIYSRMISPEDEGDYNTFEVLKNGEIIFEYADIISTNSNGDVYKSIGSNLYKNGIVIYNFNSKILDFKLDAYDNLWIVYAGNMIVVIDSSDTLIMKKKTFDFLAEDKSVNIGLTRKSKDGCDSDSIWVVYGDNKYIIELSPIGEIVQHKKISDLIITKNCDNYKINANGDFTGYDIYRKYQTTTIGLISPKNPTITLRLKLKETCGNVVNKFYDIPSCNLANGWHTFGFSFDSKTGEIKFYIDGSTAIEDTVSPNDYFIDYNKTTPLIIGGISGKLGSENEEKSIIDSQYFVGMIKNVKIYNTCIPPFGVKTIYDFTNKQFDDLKWIIESNDRNYIERINSFFLNKKPGFSSSKFNLKINGLNISSELQKTIEQSIKNTIHKIIPKHVELNSIVWS